MSHNKEVNEKTEELVEAIVEITLREAKEVTRLFVEYHDFFCHRDARHCPDALELRDHVMQLVARQLHIRHQEAFLKGRRSN